MKFDFRIANAAASNSPAAQLREQTRMACIAYGLHRLGHNVSISEAGKSLTSSKRWNYFAHLAGSHNVGGQVVVPAEYPEQGAIGIKCSVSNRNDARLFSILHRVVAHEYDLAFSASPKLIPVPFLVHDRVIEYMVQQNIFQWYLDDEVETLRLYFRNRTEKQGVGFAGYGWQWRKELAASAPEWVTFRMSIDNMPMDADAHLRWLMTFKAGLLLTGDTPKTNLHAALALLGVPIVAPFISTQTRPPLTDMNSIPLTDWAVVKAAIDNNARLVEVKQQATADYLAGWSPTGQARLIEEALL